MTGETDLWEAIRRIRAKDSRFEPETYAFLLEALEYTYGRIGEVRHVSARELFDGLCQYAKERFGVLAADVLERWGVRSPFDIGIAVYQLIEVGTLAKQEDDTLEDFDLDVDLRQVIEGEYFE
jgi:uncharacterized repeat protein (TIGR04138 family)